jgi:hypothetical protein
LKDVMVKHREKSAGPSAIDLETDAIVDLGARIRRLRRRVLLPAIIAFLMVAHVCVAAHMLGYLPILGRLADGSYFISKLTILLATLAPAVPIVGPAAVAYVVMRGRMRAAWVAEHRAKGVSEEALETNVARYG